MLVAIDLDGTTIPDSCVPSARMIDALRALPGQGHRLVIATGRTYASARPFIDAFGVTGPVICAHGAVVCNALTGVAERERPLDTAIALHVVTALAGAGLPALVLWQGGGSASARWGVPHGVGLYERLNPVERADDHTLLELCAAIERQPVLKVVGVGRDTAVARRAYALTVQLGESATVVRSKSCFVEVTARDATKGAALAHVAASLGIGAADVIAFGDAENDVSMLQWAGRSFAPVDAMSAARRAARQTMPSVDHDGVAVALRELGIVPWAPA